MARLALGSDANHAEATLVCKICGMTFLQHQMSAAEAHVRSEHPEVLRKASRCPFCDEELPDSEAPILVGHLKLRHPEEFAILLRQFGAQE
jgi:transcription elongation factor Elf1